MVGALVENTPLLFLLDSSFVQGETLFFILLLAFNIRGFYYSFSLSFSFFNRICRAVASLVIIIA